MYQTIADYIMHDLDYRCKLDEAIEAHLERTPVPRSVERLIQENVSYETWHRHLMRTQIRKEARLITGNWSTRQVFIDDRELRPDTSQRAFNHSPDGFNWGYGGSGPAQLALAILLLYLPESEAIKLHQAFKWEVVARLPQADFELTADSVKNWIEGSARGSEISGGRKMKVHLDAYEVLEDMVVEIWKGDKVIASIHCHDDGLKVISKYLDGVIHESGTPPSLVISFSLPREITEEEPAHD